MRYTHAYFLGAVIGAICGSLWTAFGFLVSK